MFGDEAQSWLICWSSSAGRDSSPECAFSHATPRHPTTLLSLPMKVGRKTEEESIRTRDGSAYKIYLFYFKKENKRKPRFYYFQWKVIFAHAHGF
jgi:hypothetical protein